MKYYRSGVINTIGGHTHQYENFKFKGKMFMLYVFALFRVGPIDSASDEFLKARTIY